MSKIFQVACACLLLLGALPGCATPAKRARQQPAAFGRLSPEDQRLVLRGKVREGLDRDAVRIAWGAPDLVTTPEPAGDGKDGAPAEVWIYRRQITTHAAIGSYDQWQPGNSLTPPGTRPWFSPGYGFGGSGYEGLLLYRPRIQYTDSFVRRAVFVRGRLAVVKTWYGEYSPLP